MQFHGFVHTLPKHIKKFIAAFLIVLSIGYATGLIFVSNTEANSVQGMEENYLGNEDLEDAPVMKFKKSEREMLTILHTHILSISFIFFMLGSIIAITSLPKKLKSFLMIEPFVSIVFTFGGIYLLWRGISWMKYVVMVSGVVMTMVFVISVLLIFIQLISKGKTNKL